MVDAWDDEDDDEGKNMSNVCRDGETILCHICGNKGICAVGHCKTCVKCVGNSVCIACSAPGHLNHKRLCQKCWNKLKDRVEYTSVSDIVCHHCMTRVGDLPSAWGKCKCGRYLLSPGGILTQIKDAKVKEVKGDTNMDLNKEVEKVLAKVDPVMERLAHYSQVVKDATTLFEKISPVVRPKISYFLKYIANLVDTKETK